MVGVVDELVKRVDSLEIVQRVAVLPSLGLMLSICVCLQNVWSRT